MKRQYLSQTFVVVYLGQCRELSHNALHTVSTLHWTKKHACLHACLHTQNKLFIAHYLLHALLISISIVFYGKVFYCSALPKIITNGYKTLNLHYFFTCGHDEVRAWTIMVSQSASCLPLTLLPRAERHQGSPSGWEDPY